MRVSEESTVVRHESEPDVMGMLRQVLANAENIYFNVRQGGKTVALPLPEIEDQRMVANFFIGKLTALKVRIAGEGDDE